MDKFFLLIVPGLILGLCLCCCTNVATPQVKPQIGDTVVILETGQTGVVSKIIHHKQAFGRYGYQVEWIITVQTDSSGTKEDLSYYDDSAFRKVEQKDKPKAEAGVEKL